MCIIWAVWIDLGLDHFRSIVEAVLVIRVTPTMDLVIQEAFLNSVVSRLVSALLKVGPWKGIGGSAGGRG
jgi:hypothetical protein